MTENKLALASDSDAGSRYTLPRIANALIRRIPFLGKSDFLRVARKGFSVSYVEEGIEAVRLPAASNHRRSANIWDQREILFRALVVAMIRDGIVDRKKNIIDVGAQNGDTAFSWAKMIDGMVYAIDPSAENIAFIRSVAKRNGIANITAFVNAVGMHEGVLYPASGIDHTYFTDTPLNRYGRRNPVAATSFDTLYANGAVADLGFIHLDVEGMELDVIRGARRVLRREQPVLTFECHITVDDVQSIFGEVRDLGYTTYMINEATPGGRPDCINFIAFPAPGISDEALAKLNAVEPRQSFYKATLGPHLIRTDPMLTT